MYKILTDTNQVMGYVDKPNYIKIAENGDILPADPVEAVGLNYQGTLYNLLGHSEIEGAPTAYASMVTDGELQLMMERQNANLYLSRKQARALEDDEDRLHVTALYDDWTTGKYEVGDIYNTHAGGSLGEEWEQTWECFQAYDNDTYPDIVPGNSAWYTFNRPLHGKSVETARPFVPVQGAHDMYRSSEYMIFTDGKTYHCLQDTAYSPTDYAAAWEVYGETTATEPTPEPTPDTDPSPAYPAWEDMEVGTALHVGDFFTYQGTTYEVLREMTVTPGWEPPALLNDFYKEV